MVRCYNNSELDSEAKVEIEEKRRVAGRPLKRGVTFLR